MAGLIEAAMGNPAGEVNAEVLRLDFDRRLMLQNRHFPFRRGARWLTEWPLHDIGGSTTLRIARQAKSSAYYDPISQSSGEYRLKIMRSPAQPGASMNWESFHATQ
jgi:hypothetical protein